MLCEVQVKEAALPDDGEKQRYLKLSIKGRQRHEETEKVAGASPSFDQSFQFTYPEGEPGSLRVSVFENNETDIDAKLASAVIPLGAPGETRDESFVLTTKDGSEFGKVHLILSISTTEAVSDNEDVNLDEITKMLEDAEEEEKEKKPTEDEDPDFLNLDDQVHVDLPDDITVPEKSEKPAEPQEKPQEPPQQEEKPAEEEEEADFMKNLDDEIKVDIPDEIKVPEKREKQEDAVVEAPAQEDGAAAAAAEDLGKSRVRVTIVEAEKITSVGNEDLVDPYCTVQVTGHQRRAKTRVMRGTASPVWNQEFVFHVAHTTGESLTLLLKDREGDSDTNEVLGKVVIPLSEVGAKKEDWWKIEPVAGKDRGRMHLVIAVEATDEESDDDPAQYEVQSGDEDSSSEEEDKLDGAVKVLAKVEVVGAKGIEKIDACCRVQVTPKAKVYKTKVVKDGAKAEWKETFKWHLEDYTQSVLVLELLDRSAPVAKAELPLSQVKKGVFDDWISLTPVGDAKRGGKILVEIKMEKTDEVSDDAQEEEDVIEVRLEESSVIGEEEEDGGAKSVKKPRNRKERLRDTVRGYNQDPDEVQSRAYEMAEETYKRWTKKMKREFKERPGLKNHPDRIIFNNAKNLKKEKEAREDPNQMSSKRLTKETEKCERELEDVNAEIEQLNQEVQDMENTA